MPTIAVNLESGDAPASVTLVALFDVLSGSAVPGVTLPAAFAHPSASAWSFAFAGTAGRYAYTYALNYSDGPSSTESGSVLGDVAAPGGTTTVEGAVAVILKADAAVAALVGTGVHPLSEPRSLPLPKVTYTRWGTDRSAASGGFANDGPTGYADAKLFFDCWADDLLSAKGLAAAARRALNGFAGTVGGIRVARVVVDDERDQPGQLVAGNARPPQRVVLEIRVTYQEQ